MKVIATILLIFLTSLQYDAGARIIYVDSTAAGANNGSDWTNAFNTLSAALADANAATSSDSLYIAAGTYYPPGTMPSIATDSVFGIYRSGIKLYGGFPIGGGIRDTANHVTLSGALSSQNSCAHVIVIAGLAANTDSVILDGLTITGGAAKSSAANRTFNGILIPGRYGGGLCVINNNSTPIAIRNCRVVNNTAAGKNASMGVQSTDAMAGGILVRNSTINISSSTVSDNRCQGGASWDGGIIGDPGSDAYGGGIYMDSTTFSVTGCHFASDMASPGGDTKNGYGSAIYCRHSSGDFTNCGFGNNTVYGYGGGIYADTSIISVSNCTLYGNKAYSWSLIYWNSYGPGQGSAIYATGSTTNIYNSILWNNPGPTPNYTNNSVNGVNSISGSIYQGGYSGSGNLNKEPQFVNAAANDFHLLVCDVAINAGNNSYVTNILVDADGQPRIFDTTVDIGMYELQDTPKTAPYVAPISGPASWCPGATNVQYTDITPGGVWSSTGYNISIDSITGAATIPPNYGDEYDLVRYTVSDSNGCYTSQTLNVATVSKNWLMIDDSNLPYSFWPNNTPLTLSNPRWISCDSGNSFVHYGMTFNPTINGNYAAVVNIAGCPDTSSCFTVDWLGINTITKAEEVNVYPNPATSYITIATNTSIPQMIVLKNILGTTLRQIIPTGNTTTVTLSGLSAGIYILEIWNKDSRETRRIILK